MTKSRKLAPTSLLLAPDGVDVENIRKILESRGVRVTEWRDLFAPGLTLFESVESVVRDADFVVAVLDGSLAAAEVLVGAGVARAKGKRLLILSPAGAVDVPALLKDAFLLSVAPQNSLAIGFAVDQLLAVGKGDPLRRRARTTSRRTLGTLAHELLGSLEQWTSSEAHSHSSLEAIVEKALRALPLSAVSASDSVQPGGADFAVWDDALESLGNPILIELKTDVRGRILQEAQGQLARQLERSNATFGLLLWGIGPDPVITRTFQRTLHRQVFSWSVEAFLKSLSTQPFADVVLALATSTEPRETR